MRDEACVKKRQRPGTVQRYDASLVQIGCRLRIGDQQGPVWVKLCQQSKIGECCAGARGCGQGFCLRLQDRGSARGLGRERGGAVALRKDRMPCPPMHDKVAVLMHRKGMAAAR